MLDTASSARTLVSATLVLLHAIIAAPAGAQEVRGTVRLEALNDPVSAAVVELLDESGAAVRRSLTDERGVYRIVAPNTGQYRLRVERIGLAAHVSAAFDVPAAGVLIRDVVVGLEPISLAGITVERTSRCSLQRDAPVSIQRLWDEASKMLRSVSLLENVWSVRFDVRHWERDIDVRTRFPSNVRERRSVVTHAQPFASIPPEALLLGGFIREEGDSTAYYAPDADALLSDAFLQAYCFRVVSGRDGRIGLGFEPIEPAAGQDIKGVLWLDRQTAALQELEFNYTNVESAALDLRTGGSVSFAQLANGAWIISRWQLRMPRFAIVNGMPTGRIVLVHEAGGEVLHAQLVRRRETRLPTESIIVAESPTP